MAALLLTLFKPVVTAIAAGGLKSSHGVTQPRAWQNEGATRGWV